MTFRAISGILFVVSLMIVYYIGIYAPLFTVKSLVQADLNSLPGLKADWQMNFNVAKYHSMRVSRHPSP